MMKAHALIAVALLSLVSATSTAFAAIDPTGDLSGAWTMTFKHEPASKFDFVMIKTDLTVKKPDGTTGPYYIVQAESLGGMKVIGASIRKNAKGLNVIDWRRFAVQGDKNVLLDSEFSLILGTEDDTLILGGDHEQTEVARMTKRKL